jgi:phosphoribosyl 1,2-cyclic phosphate phosphodiesterase
MTGLTAVVLGCGTSHGVPMIGCLCPVCESSDPRNKRTRSSLFLSGDDYDVLIDTPPEIRLQLCREGISQIDRVLITHSHADHVMGMDDLRRINELTGQSVPVYARPAVQDDLQRIFRYSFEPPEQVGGGLPRFELFDAPPVMLPDIEVFEVMHGSLPVLGVKVRAFAYLTDVSEIPANEEARLRGLETLIIDATRLAPHPTHLNLEGALKVIERLQPKQAYLTHLSHDYDFVEWSAKLPRGVELSRDGLRIPIA